jgi:hypothetical protein
VPVLARTIPRQDTQPRGQHGDRAVHRCYATTVPELGLRCNFVAVSGRSGKSDKTARRRLGSQPRAPGLHSSRQTDPGHTTIIDRIGELDAKALHILAVVFAMLVRMPRRG